MTGHGYFFTRHSEQIYILRFIPPSLFLFVRLCSSLPFTHSLILKLFFLKIFFLFLSYRLPSLTSSSDSQPFHPNPGTPSFLNIVLPAHLHPIYPSPSLRSTDKASIRFVLLSVSSLPITTCFDTQQHIILED